MTIQVLIPLKRLASAKQRLGPAVSRASRRRLMLHMLGCAVDAAREAGIGPVALVTSEPTAPELAATRQIQLLSDGDLPWNEGLLHALCSIQPAPLAVLYLSADLPLVSAVDITRFVDAQPIPAWRSPARGTAEPMRCWFGPADAITPAFGRQPSAAGHANLAARRGIPVLIVDIPGLALDVDTINDLRAAQTARKSAGILTNS